MHHQALQPCLVLGTGFHRWVLGATMGQDFEALHSWPALLLQVAKALGVALDGRTDHLSLLWEQLLTNAVHDGLRPGGQQTSTSKANPPLAAHQVELQAKRAAAGVLQQLQDSYPAHSQRAQFPLDAAWGAVVSLNFDAHWWQAVPQLRWAHAHSGQAQPLQLTAPVTGHAGIPGEELQRLNNHLVLQTDPAKRLWFPNGYLGRPRSLRLGLREFGHHPSPFSKPSMRSAARQGPAPGLLAHPPLRHRVHCVQGLERRVGASAGMGARLRLIQN